MTLLRSQRSLMPLLVSLHSTWGLGSPDSAMTSAASAAPIPKVSFISNEAEFRWTLLQDSMAFDKLHEGIKKFAEDGEALKALLRKKLEA